MTAGGCTSEDARPSTGKGLGDAGASPEGSAAPTTTADPVSDADGATAPRPADTGSNVNDLPCGPCDSIAQLEPCCTTDGECGAMYLGSAGAGCVALDQEGRIDPTCPTPDDQPAGCCLPSGVCGAFYTRTFGCVPYDAFPGFSPEPVPCGSGTPSVDAAPPDAG